MPIPEPARGKALKPRAIGAFYDLYLLGFSDSEPSRFMNYGYWYPTTQNKTIAQENLMEKLVSGIQDRSGRILDVACGTGATTRFLGNHWNPAHIFGINVSTKQVSKCRQGSSCSFCVMDAASIAFSDDSFQSIICVEAAFHFDTRERFLRDCVRLLKPGGVLALTDLLLHEAGHDLLPMWPRANWLPNVSEYHNLLLRVGFSHANVIDITEEGWRSYARHTFAELHDEWMLGKSDFPRLQQNLAWMYRLAATHKYNLMCFAVK
jgi:MPBQ/MSBQ methyltransferase